MRKVPRTRVLSALTAVALTAGLAFANTQQASAISEVKCGPGTGYLKITVFVFGAPEDPIETCFALAGEQALLKGLYLTRISTGNNRAQFHTRGTWTRVIPKFTIINHNATHIDKIRIL